MQRSADPEGDLDAGVPAILREFNIEDDGSEEWNYTIDLIGAVSPAIEGRGVDECLAAALRIYLDSIFNSRARAYGDEAARAVSIAEVRTRIVTDPVWGKVLKFVDCL
jgi:hypothetical protein